MKKRNKLFLLALSLVLILSLAIGCSGGGFDKSSNEMTSDSLAGSGSDGGGASPMAPPMEWDMVAEESALEPEKVITTINLEFETTEFDQTTNDLMKLVEKYKAYIENSDRKSVV